MRSTLTSPRVEDMKRKRRLYRTRLTILITILSVSLIGALAYFSGHPRISIKTITVTGTHIINPADIESLVTDSLSGKYVYLFTKRNSFIYPHRKIYSTILSEFPRIDTLSVYREGITTLHIAITERAGSYLYCGESVPEAITDVGENCYFINNDGYVFDKAPYFSGSVYFKYYLPLPEGVSSPLGSQVVSVDTFHSLAQFVDGVAGLGLKPNYVAISADGSGTLSLVHADGATTPQILFKNTDDLHTMLGNLTAAMTKPQFANEVTSKYSSLLYIDLRFNNKVVYKFNE